MGPQDFEMDAFVRFPGSFNEEVPEKKSALSQNTSERIICSDNLILYAVDKRNLQG